MPRVVRDADERDWIVTPQVHLSEAQTHLGEAEFSDAAIRAISLLVSALLFLGVLFSVPADFWAPTLVYGPLLLSAGAFMLWWAWRRPWSVRAVPADSDDGADAEIRWVRGPWEALQAYQDAVEEHSSGDERSLAAARDDDDPARSREQYRDEYDPDAYDPDAYDPDAYDPDERDPDAPPRDDWADHPEDEDDPILDGPHERY